MKLPKGICGGLLVGMAVFGMSLHAGESDPEMGLQFAPDGTANLQNSLVELQANNATGRFDGIVGWKFKPTGYEMVDVLYRNLDANGGHLLGLLWDRAERDSIPARVPEIGSMFVPVVAGVTDDGRALVLEQVTQGNHRLTRTLILRRDFGCVEARFRLENLDAEAGGFALRFHNVMSPGARGQYQSSNDLVFAPGKQGLLQWQQNLPLDKFKKTHAGFALRREASEHVATIWRGRVQETVSELSGNWVVQTNPENGDGMALIVQEDDLVGFYNHPLTTVEPFFKAKALQAGQVWETRIFIAAFSGAKGVPIKGATPLYAALEKPALDGGRLTATLCPTFTGTLKVEAASAPGKSIAEFKADPMEAIQIDVQAPENWMLIACDQAGAEIGRIGAEGSVSLFEPTISREEKEKPKVTGSVYEAADSEKVIRETIRARDFVIQCDWSESEPVRTLAEKMALQLGVGVAWTPRFSGKMVALGSPNRSATVRNAGLLKQSVDSMWPGSGRGAILTYDNFESTTEPLILVAGSDDEGALAAANAFYDKYVKDVPAAEGFDVWASPVSELGMVWSRPVTGSVLEKIEIQSARNEYDSAQVVLTPYESLSDIEVTVDPLIHAGTGEPMEVDKSNRYRQRHGPIRVRWAEPFPLKMEEGWPGRPDGLLSRPVTSLPAGKSQVIWLTTLVGENAEPGLYKSALHVKVGEVTKSVPIEVEVYDFSLPETGLKGEAYMAMHLMAPDRLLRGTDIERLVRSLVEHRFRIIFLKEPGMIRWHVSPEGKFKGIHTDFLMSNADGTLLMDTSRFDWLQQKCDQYSKPIELEFNVPILDVIEWPTGISEFSKAFPDRYADKPGREGHKMQSYWAEEMLGMFAKHLERRGLSDRVAIKVGDEPPGFDFWWNNHAQAAIEAGLQFGTAFNAIDWAQAEKALGSKLNRFKPLYQQFDAEFARKAQAAGHSVGWYNCGPPPRSNTGTSASELRSYYWQAAKYGLDFVSRWGVQCWGSEGNTPENIWTFRHSHHHSLVYPPHPDKPPYTQEGMGWVDVAPLDSIRYELIRDGIEDADYVAILRQRIGEAKEAGLDEAAAEGEKVLQDIWSSMFPSLNQYDPPYPQLMAARSRVADTIVNLQAKLAEKLPKEDREK